ncbi:MAG: hypothetical protein K6C40_04150 [Thermoguttaceae bacterium]|nr:hypothetical protein [Thermoguttaceae bacterium]
MPVLKLKSLQTLFRSLEEEQIENFSRRILFVMRDGDLTLPQERIIRKILKKTAFLTDETIINYAVATAVISEETTDLAERRELVQALIDLAQTVKHSSSMLEIAARATVNLMAEKDLPLEAKKELLTVLHGLTLARDATPDIFNIYAQGLFNMVVDDPSMQGKRVCAHQLRTLALYGKGTVFTLIQAAKAHVNLAYLTDDERERINCLSTLEFISHKPLADSEVKLIYTKGLMNFILDEKNQETFRNRYFQKLKKLAQAPDASWDIREAYSHALLNMALQTENLREKRLHMREIMKLVEMPGCIPDIYVTAARAIFNHLIDETSLKRQKDCITWLEIILERSGQAPLVMREYARSLVNIAIEDPEYTNKRLYSEKLQELTKTKDVSLDVVIEYAKSLLNLALVNESKEQKAKDLKTLMSIDETIHYTRTDLYEKTEIDYICVKAEALAMMIPLEPDPSKRIQLVDQLPDIEEFNESNYVGIFLDICKDAVTQETDFGVQCVLAMYFEKVFKVLGIHVSEEDQEENPESRQPEDP